MIYLHVAMVLQILTTFQVMFAILTPQLMIIQFISSWLSM